MKFVNLFICPVCGKNTNTFRHPFAKVWCPSCGHILREEGDRSIQHSGLEKIEPLKVPSVFNNIFSNDDAVASKLNQVIENQNKIIDYLNQQVKK